MGSANWLSEEKASSEILHEIEAAAGELPRSYLALLARGNGGDVSLRVNPFTFCLDSTEAALAYWKSGTYTALDVFAFGGNGAGMLLAFHIGKPGCCPVVECDPVDPDGSTDLVAMSFEDLLAQVERMRHNLSIDTDRQAPATSSRSLLWSSHLKR